MLAKCFPQETTRPGPNDGDAHFAARDHPQAAVPAIGHSHPVRNETALDDATASSPGLREILPTLETAGSGKLARRRGISGHQFGGRVMALPNHAGVRRLRPTRRRLARMALPLFELFRARKPC